MRRIPLSTPLALGTALLLAGGLAAGCSSSSSSNGSKGAAVTIKAMLPPNTGPITASDNAGLKNLTDQYQAAHKNVTVQWLPNNSASITSTNAATVAAACGQPCASRGRRADFRRG